MDTGRLRHRASDPGGARDGRLQCSPTLRWRIASTSNLLRQTFAARSTRTSRVGSGNLIGWLPAGRAAIGAGFVVVEIGSLDAAGRVGAR